MFTLDPTSDRQAAEIVGGLVTELGTFRSSVGGAADEAKTHAVVVVTGEVASYPQRDIVATTVHVDAGAT